jgi:hypothetical protein
MRPDVPGSSVDVPVPDRLSSAGERTQPEVGTMPMEIAASLDSATVVQLLNELTPLTVHVGGEESRGERWIRVETPEHVEFVAGEGLRIRTGARLQWTVAGIRIPFVIRSLQLMLRPMITQRGTEGRLVFRASIESADLKNVPSVIDDGIVAKVNDLLAMQGDMLAWNFGEMLTRTVTMPDSMEPIDALQLNATNGIVEVHRDGLRFALKLPMRFARGTES